MVCGLWFIGFRHRVQGLWFMVYGLLALDFEFKVFWFMVYGLGLGVRGFGFGAWSLGLGV